MVDERSAVLETEALTRDFGDFRAVDAVTLSVLRGEIFGLIGPNGAGKSTLVKMLTTLLPPTSGRARVAGFDVVAEAAAVRAHIGYVPQLLSADGNLTVAENLLMSARLYCVPRRDRRRRIEAALADFGLADAADRLVQTCSGGMIRRLEIAQSVIHEPAVLFMDEPTVGLDPVGRRTVWSHVRDLRDRLGTTVLMTTHLMDEAADLCDRIAVIDRGRLVALDTPKGLEARIGPGATLDDVFAAIAGGEEETGSFRDVRQARNSAREHA